MVVIDFCDTDRKTGILGLTKGDDDFLHFVEFCNRGREASRPYKYVGLDK